MISVVIPIYNEQDLIARLHAEVRSVMQKLNEDWEVVYVDDGSRDASLRLLLREQSLDPHICIVQLSRNWGHQPALTAGLRQARGDAVVFMDGDLQDPPSVIADMVAAWRAGAEVVIPCRRSRQERGLRGLLFRSFYHVLDRLSDYQMPSNSGIFGLLDRKAADVVAALPERNRYFPGLRAWVGFRTATVTYDRAARAAGETKQSLRRLFRYSLDAIFGFSYQPLRAALAAGTLMSIAGLLGMLAVAVFALFGSAPLPLATLAVLAAVALVGGVQLLCTWMVAEYIGRVYDEVRQRPLYVVRQVHTAESSAQSTFGSAAA